MTLSATLQWQPIVIYGHLAINLCTFVSASLCDPINVPHVNALRGYVISEQEKLALSHILTGLDVQLDIWDHSRSEPVSSFSWGADTLVAVRFNPAEPDILASCASDRSLALYDLRHSTPIRKIVMQVSHSLINLNMASCCLDGTTSTLIPYFGSAIINLPGKLIQV